MSALTSPCALHIVHGYNEPFLSLTALYTRAMRQNGWRVITVYLTGHPDPAIVKQSAADQVIFLEANTASLRGLKLALAWQLRTLIKQHAVSMIIGQRYKPMYLGLLASVLLNIPVLGIGHAFGVTRARSRQQFLRRFSARLTLAGVSQAVTLDMQNYLPSVQCVCLPNAIDVAALEAGLRQRDDARRILALNDTDFIFGNVGRLHPDKDQATLIRAFALIADAYPNTKLLLIGQGKSAQEYRDQIDALRLHNRILLTGLVPDAATLFTAFDVYVSASNREPFGIVLTEAMLAKLPVISTDCGGAPEVLGEHARYFQAGNAQALAEQMRACLDDTEATRQQIGNRLYQRLQEKFSFPVFAAHLKTQIDSIMTRSAHVDVP